MVNKVIKNILLATDLAAHAHKVAARAIQMAKLYKANLSVIYAFEYQPISYGAGELSIPSDMKLIMTFKENSHKALKHLGKEIGVPEEQLYFVENLHKTAILDCIKKNKIDLLVIGSHGTHGLSLLLGSTPDAIFHAAPSCDILAVRI
jgi:universal stress protein A